MSDLLKREDVPFEVAMALTQHLLETAPESKLVFAGDNPEAVTPETQEFLEMFQAACKKSLDEGTCWGCGAPVPGWPKAIDFGDIGWGSILIDGKEHVAFECPTCVGPNVADNNFGVAVVDADGNVEMARNPNGDSQQSG